MNDILVALITGGLALIGSAIGVFSGIKTSQKVTEVKIAELTREVREHNHFAKRIPVVEEQIKVINHRIEDLEGKVRRMSGRKWNNGFTNGLRRG